MANNIHAQIFLEPEQHQALAEMAAARGVSVSQVLREIVGDFLVARQAKRARVNNALEKLNEIREEIQTESGMIDPNFLEKIREERMHELWGRMKMPGGHPGSAEG